MVLYVYVCVYLIEIIFEKKISMYVLLVIIYKNNFYFIIDYK